MQFGQSARFRPEHEGGSAVKLAEWPDSVSTVAFGRIELSQNVHHGG
jgi:hypothetical protein